MSNPPPPPPTSDSIFGRSYLPLIRGLGSNYVNLSYILKLFLNFSKFEPQYSYKYILVNKTVYVNEEGVC